ncbi:MAG: hypothetical protein HKP58_02615, partial [Desulfatitalea sp.]|nr:hypothetical protein [Desulfatitalea sp.]NNJ99283.1 hypothetical protein [Desulfatitalea sp.]
MKLRLLLLFLCLVLMACGGSGSEENSGPDFDKNRSVDATDIDDGDDRVADEFDALSLDAGTTADLNGDGTGDDTGAYDDNEGALDETDTPTQRVPNLDVGIPPITDSLYDGDRALLYLTHKESFSFSIIEAQTGTLIQSISFDHMPEHMAMSPDGARLYVALLVQDHSSYWWEEDQSGYIAVIDLERQVYVDTFQIATDPYDLVVTRGGKLIVSSGSGQWTDIYAYDAQTGDALGRADIYQRSRLTLHPSENWVFAADTGLVPSDIQRFDISGAGIVAGIDSPYKGDHRMAGNIWATPDGNYLITRGGDVFSAPEMTFVASLTCSDVCIEDLFFDETEAIAFIVDSNGLVHYFNLTSLEMIDTVNEFDHADRVIVSGQNLIAISPRQGAAGYQLVQTAHPCPACGENT